jgi:hypothetical protein
VGEHEWDGVGMPRRHVQEVDRQIIHGDVELRDSVESLLGRPPVVLFPPASAQLGDDVQRDALRPVGDGLPVGPAGPSQA